MQYFPTKWYYWGSWHCMLPLGEQVAAIFHHVTSLGLLAMHFHFCPIGGSIFPQVISLGMLAMNTHTSRQDKGILPQEIFIVNLGNVFSNVSAIWQPASSQKGFSWGCWQCILTLVKHVAAFFQQLILLGLLAMHCKVCTTSPHFSTKWYYCT